MYFRQGSPGRVLAGAAAATLAPRGDETETVVVGGSSLRKVRGTRRGAWAGGGALLPPIATSQRSGAAFMGAGV